MLIQQNKNFDIDNSIITKRPDKLIAKKYLAYGKAEIEQIQ